MKSVKDRKRLKILCIKKIRKSFAKNKQEKYVFYKCFALSTDKTRKKVYFCTDFCTLLDYQAVTQYNLSTLYKF